MDVKRWLWQISNEGHDTYGAFELPVGAAVLLSMGYAALRIEFPWLGRLVIIGLFVAALAIGHRQERRIISPGTRHRPRGILLLTSTWLVAVWALLWAGALLLLARVRAWSRLSGWSEGSLLLTLVLCLATISLGVKTGVRRWVILGAALAVWAVLIPGIPFLRHAMHLSTGVLVGGSLIASGLLGQRALTRSQDTA